MLSYIVEGGRKLEGIQSVSGSKNASLPILAACILSGDQTVLYNVPNILDIQATFKIMKSLGCKVKRINEKVKIDSAGINSYEIPDELMRKMRSSVVIAGALIGRFKKASFSYPGDYDIWCIHLFTDIISDRIKEKYK